jgi:exodeoxyribonuclease III
MWLRLEFFRLMKIATFNVNGIAARLPRLLEWLAEFSPDVATLQEIKCMDDKFPRLEIEALGYQLETFGQKSFNGVALLSKTPITDIMRGLPGDAADEQSRYIEGTVNGIRICGLYLPNGNPQPGPKFEYKLAWMERLIARAKHILASEIPAVMLGDYNVCPTAEDVFDEKALAGDALIQPESRAKWRELLNLGFLDAARAIQPVGRAYSFWDYQAGAWAKDHGLRIDHIFLSPQAADRLENCCVDRKPRAQERASDHTPVWVELR